MQLAEHAARTEKRERDPDDCGNRALAWLRGFLRNVLHNLKSAWIEKIAHLLRDLVPRACRIIAENHSYDRKQYQNQRRERKNCVIGKSCSQLRRFILQPFPEGLL